MSDLNCDKDHSHTTFCYLHGEPVDPKLMENFNREMRENVIPAIIKGEKEQAQLANLARFGLLPVVRQIQDDARKEATTWYAQYQAWMKRGMEAEARESILALKTQKMEAALRLIAGEPLFDIKVRDIARAAIQESE